MKELLERYRAELDKELQKILSYWSKYAVDNINGGFYGKIDNNNNINDRAPKGSVLNARILWTFAVAYNHTHNKDLLAIADRAFEYFTNNFIDQDHGGVYWSIDYSGKPLDSKKQIYASAFALYAMSEYHKCNGSALAEQLALDLYNTIVARSYDKINGGYLEAFTREWQPLEDLRLSAKDDNEKKSMNTHLHVLEAFSNLYSIIPDAQLKKNIQELIRDFLDHIIDKKTHHLILFFDEQWNHKPGIISYGHDIEASWLLMEAADIIGDEELMNKLKETAIAMTTAVEEGLDNDGGLWYEYEPATHHLVKEKHWWAQAEAMVGFFNTWQITDDKKYFERSLANWDFVKKYIIDHEKGEWFWGVKENHKIMEGEDKVGIWKCPYHNARACMEIIRRIDAPSNH